MHGFLAHLTAALLLAHALLGCCWHHDHAVEGGLAEPAGVGASWAAVLSTSAACCHVASHSDSPRHGPLVCKDGKCDVARPTWGPSLDLAARPAAGALAPGEVSGAGLLADWPSSAVVLFHGSVRLHLANQVLRV